MKVPSLQGKMPGTALIDESLEYDMPQPDTGKFNVKTGNLNLNKPKAPDMKSSIAGSIENERQGLIQIDSPKSRGSIKDFELDVKGPQKQSRLDSLKNMAKGVKDIMQPPRIQMGTAGQNNLKNTMASPTPKYEDTGFNYEFLGRG